MKVTVLVENSVAADRVDLRAEHGLSLHLEFDGRRILFDAGAGDAFAYNAEKLGINLRDVDLAVISHHHFDHGGGLARFLAANEKAPICLHGDAPSDCRLRLAGGLVDKHIGLDGELFRKHAGRFRFIRESSAIAPGVFLLTEAGDAHPQPKGNRILYTRENARCRPDLFQHELALVIEGDRGLAVCTSCSHRGVLNILDAAGKRFAGRPIAAVFGGFHLRACATNQYVCYRSTSSSSRTWVAPLHTVARPITRTGS